MLSKYRVTNVIYPTHLSSCADDFLLIHIVRVCVTGWDPYVFSKWRRFHKYLHSTHRGLDFVALPCAPPDLPALSRS